jgi:large repetitive protein
MIPKTAPRSPVLLFMFTCWGLLTLSAFAQSTPVILSPTMPAGLVGQSYYQQLNALGGTPPYTWSQAGGTIPPGTTFSSSGVLSGNPVVAGVYGFSLQVTDKAQATDRKDFSIVVSSGNQQITGLTIMTPSPLPVAAVGSAYSMTLQALGGSPPYNWGLPSGSLPPGLTFAPGGVISGTPTSAGTYSFTIELTDNARGRTTTGYILSVSQAAAPQVSFTGMPATLGPAQQIGLALQLTKSYPFVVQGEVNLSFTPNAVAQADDPAVQFSSGGRRITFTIPANSTQPLFSGSGLNVQTGTVAGTISLVATMQYNGTDVTPLPVPTLTAQVARIAPEITNVTVARKAGGFDVSIIGDSTPREVTSATFQFTGSSGETFEVTVNVSGAFQGWYRQAGSAVFGSQFALIQPFTVQGDATNVKLVTVTLTNSVGTSQAAKATF